MNVMEALKTRRSARAFLPKPIEKEKLHAIFEAAARTPSWANTQPWEVFVASDATLERIREGYRQNYENKVPGAPETPRPIAWPDAEKKRQQQLYPDMKRDCGDAVEKFGSLNMSMFNAPAVIFLCIDQVLSEWSMYDVGAYAQSIMLAAQEQGLSTIPAITLVLYPDVIRREMNIPKDLKITIGIAIGYADEDNKINDFKSGRKPLKETVRFLD
ncbi:MAG TPA: nitroreductase [Bacillota bacterium]|nr:nitroreductase [Bacillota bacterium]